MWDVVVHDGAVPELRSFKKRDQRMFKVIVDELTKLASMPDPRKSTKVAHLDFDAPGWYRLKITHPYHVRVIFRLLDSHMIEIKKYGEISDEEEKNYIQVTRVAKRDSRTYAEPLYNRYFSILKEAV